MDHPLIETRNQIVIAAPPERIYAYAAPTERWPEYLPHYRYVRLRSSQGRCRVLEMGASRDGLPVRWTAEQINDPITPEIRFRHIEGWTRGMEVVWHFEPEGAGTRVIIDHKLEFDFPIASDFLGRHFVCNFFVHNIAAKTLARIKVLAETSA